ncbi:MAG: protein translocase subunit SecF [Firmicutes bacterium]|nr:protein translocase subunit SecF [Bacillota bacterium]
MLKYIESSPSHIAGMAIFLICMIAFILWVTTFRTRTRDIIKHKNIFFGISGVIIVLCLGTFLFKGLNWGLDFTGGTQLQIAIKPEYNTAQVREAVTEYASKNPELQKKFDDAKVQLEENIKENVTLNDNSNVFAQETPAAPPVAGQPAPGAPAAPPVAGQPAPGAPAAPPVEGQPAPGAPAAPPAGQPAPNATDVAPVGQPAPGAPVVATPAAPATETAPAAVPSPDAKDDKKAKEEESPKPVKMAKFKKCIIQCKPLSSDEVNGLMVFLQNKLGDVELLKLETVGPTIGQDLSRKGLLALLIALGAQLLYITFRFGTQFRYGVAADIALLHDLIVMVGLYSLLGRPIDSNFLAALLTIVGYSVMDSVVVFDRIRENLHIMKGKSYEETVNLSLNQTITRSALASMTVIMSAFAIYFFGGATLNSFAIALLIGLITGTYSSLFVASPILIVIDDWAKSSEKQRVDARRKKLQDEADAKAQSKSETTEKKSIKSDITPQDYPTPGEVSDNKDEISGGRRVKGERKRRR